MCLCTSCQRTKKGEENYAFSDVDKAPEDLAVTPLPYVQNTKIFYGFFPDTIPFLNIS
jgi:hypothetical protein